MTQKEKIDLLLKDLCARQPHNVKVHAKYTDLGETIELDGIVKMIDNDGVVGIEVINDFSSGWTYIQIDNIKPYLFPMSLMTEEQKKEYQYITERWMYDSSYSISDSIDWLNKNNFDYRGLIPMGLANDATRLNVY